MNSGWTMAGHDLSRYRTLASYVLIVTKLWVSDITEFSVTTGHQLQRQVGERSYGI